MAVAGREAGEWQDVIILAYDADGDLVIRSSHMSRKDALWLLMDAQDWARGRFDE